MATKDTKPEPVETAEARKPRARVTLKRAIGWIVENATDDTETHCCELVADLFGQATSEIESLVIAIRKAASTKIAAEYDAAHAAKSLAALTGKGAK